MSSERKSFYCDLKVYTVRLLLLSPNLECNKSLIIYFILKSLLLSGNYLVIALDLITLGSGFSSELYQMGAYTIHGETFVR